MSFRVRLSLFFVLIVVLPLVAIAVLVSEISDDSRAGKADAQLAIGLQTGLAAYEESVTNAKVKGSELVRDPSFAAAADGGEVSQVEALARELTSGVEYLCLTLPGGEEVQAIPASAPLAVANVTSAGADGGTEASLSVTGPTEYLETVRRQTGLDAALARGDRVIAATVAADDLTLPDAGAAEDAEVEGEGARAGAGELPDSGGTRLVLFAPVEPEGFLDSSPRVAAALAIFLVIAFALVGFLVRTLQGQVAAMLHAARRIGEGDFTRKVPVIGRDEMAGLASEFNKMSDRLAAQMDQLRRQRSELDRSVQRLGEAFAAGLDRDALLAIMIETALGACEAEYGRIVLTDGSTVEVPAASRGAAAEAAVRAQKTAGRDRAPADTSHEGAYAIAAPLYRLGRAEEVVGTMAVGRMASPFDPRERDVFRYLIGQATASLENISAHELVSEQAVTDELTGLPNNRAFREAMDREGARAERFGHDLSLILLDIDDFKLVNDTHGHLQGDEVLRRIGQIISDESREIDEPARYGGEEFVVALPETDLDGAVEVAERIRAHIEAEPIDMLDGSGEMYVSASFGAASLPASAGDVSGLIKAADQALYAAKADGKNRVCVAPDANAPKKAAKGRAPARRR